MRLLCFLLSLWLLVGCDLMKELSDFDNDTVIDLPNYNLVYPIVETLPLSHIDYEDSTVTLNGELKNLGFFGDVYLTNRRGFVIWNVDQKDTLKVYVPDCELGLFSYNLEKWPFELPIGISAFAAVDTVGIIGIGKTVYLNGPFIDIPEAVLAVQTQDIGFGSWDYISSCCKNSIVGGFDDWRLPSVNELYILYSERERIGGFVADYYWTGQSADTYHYYNIHFKDGYLSTSDGNHYGRCVRSL